MWHFSLLQINGQLFNSTNLLKSGMLSWNYFTFGLQFGAIFLPRYIVRKGGRTEQKDRGITITRVWVFWNVSGFGCLAPSTLPYPTLLAYIPEFMISMSESGSVGNSSVGGEGNLLLSYRFTASISEILS